MLAKKSISRIGSVLFIIIVFILAATPHQAAHAAGIRYTKPGGSGDCSSWANACTLQTALAGAVSGDEIWAAAGTYKPTTPGSLLLASPFSLRHADTRPHGPPYSFLLRT